MENVVSSKVKWMRGLAFAFIVMNYVAGSLFQNVISDFFINTFDLSHSDSRIITSTIITSFYLVFAGLMTYLAAIKANRIYAILFMVDFITIPLMFVNFPESEFRDVFIHVWNILLSYLIPLYCISVIFQNNYSRLDIKTQKWLPLIVLPTILFAIIYITHNFCYDYIWDLKGLERDYAVWENMIYSSILYTPWAIIMLSLALIGIFKLIYSPAFGGNYNPNVKGDFNPLNKYFLGSLGAVAIGVAGLSALYYFGL